MKESDLKKLDELLSELIIEAARQRLPKSHIQNITDLRTKTLPVIGKAKK